MSRHSGAAESRSEGAQQREPRILILAQRVKSCGRFFGRNACEAEDRRHAQPQLLLAGQGKLGQHACASGAPTRTRASALLAHFQRAAAQRLEQRGTAALSETRLAPDCRAGDRGIASRTCSITSGSARRTSTRFPKLSSAPVRTAGTGSRAALTSNLSDESIFRLPRPEVAASAHRSERGPRVARARGRLDLGSRDEAERARCHLNSLFVGISVLPSCAAGNLVARIHAHHLGQRMRSEHPMAQCARVQGC